MIKKDAQLNENIWDIEKLDQEPTRNGFGRGLVEAGEADERVVALCADLASSTRAHWFQEKFPDRYVEVGVAEQNLAATAAGFANYGKIPFIMSYAAFSPGRNNEQIRTTISLSHMPVNVIGCHAGLSVGPDGATHQALEDIGLMRMQPNMVVVVPCDAHEAQKATRAIAQNNKPSYLRLARAKAPVFTTEDTHFEIGKAQIFYEADLKDASQKQEDKEVEKKYEATIFACGDMVYQSLVAVRELESEKNLKLRVVNMATIKPLDVQMLEKCAEDSRTFITVEEHQIAGGLGSTIVEYISEKNPLPVKRIGVEDRFGQSGQKEDLYKEYGLDVEGIKKSISDFLEAK